MSKALPWIKVGVSVDLLGTAAYLLDWQQARLLILETSLADLVMALALLLGAYLANGLRLIRLQHRVAPLMPGPLFWGTYYTGLLMNYVLPSGVGGDVVVGLKHADGVRAYCATPLVESPDQQGLPLTWVHN